MRYIGGKSKIAQEISQAILDNSQSRKYYLEPFVGGMSVFPLLAQNFEWSVGGDMQEDLILLWNSLIFDCWTPPETVSELEYAELKKSEPSALRAIVGFGGSFGGKFFGGYARGGKNSDGSPRDHQNESIRSAVKTREYIHANFEPSCVGRFRCQSYLDWEPISGTVIYCDPPYALTQGYSTGDFDSDKFWETMRSWSDRGCEVFVSEYNAPNDFKIVWEKSHRQSLTKPDQGRNKTIERLFTRNI